MTHEVRVNICQQDVPSIPCKVPDEFVEAGQPLGFSTEAPAIQRACIVRWVVNGAHEHEGIWQFSDDLVDNASQAFHHAFDQIGGWVRGSEVHQQVIPAHRNRYDCWIG